MTNENELIRSDPNPSGNTGSTGTTLKDYFSEISMLFNDTMDKIKEVSEQKWNALSKQDQLDYFCAVVRRIHKGEIEEGRSYRGILYEVFGFGPESYAQAQLSGYLDIHNFIFSYDNQKELLTEFAEHVKKSLVGNSTLDEVVSSFMIKKYV